MREALADRPCRVIEKQRQGPHLVLFEGYPLGGHRGEYIHRLVQYWCNHRLEGQLDVVVGGQSLRTQPELSETLRQGGSCGVRVVELEETYAGGNYAHLLSNSLKLARALRACIRRLQPDKCLLMYLDHLQVPLALGLRFEFPVKFAGIYFRPSFHYSQCGFSGGQEGWAWPLLQRLRLSAAARNPHMETIFCLDPYSVPAVKAIARAQNVVALPDPVDFPEAQSDPLIHRGSLGIEQHRAILLLFGGLAERKGTLQMVKACSLLPEAVCRKICLLLAGRVPEGDRGALLQAITEARVRRPLQIILRDERIPADDVQNLFAVADLILAPYQGHVGSSGILLRAAAAGRPVLTQEYGLMGHLVRAHNLGITVDASRPDEIARALRRALDMGPQALFDVTQARKFADAHAGDAFASTIFDHIQFECGPGPER